ncbi:hypothetical protein C8N43_1004 [Litoreibacter ponti]|uniref:Uncharacterized protein n=1 Tax=Litoreibacter ponti TaxID=1510457 RepID=A0A2T6BJV4_9RHOB|nr:hypothetical protein [Litoreibacter ponti]PTX56347.1 hypothetical protein C8N43_1004 [Litoreibacter ponti]
MTKLIQNVAEMLAPAPAAQMPPVQIEVTQLTRREMEDLFARELGRIRLH